MTRTETIKDNSSQRTGADPRPGLVILFSEGEFPDDGIYPMRPEITIGRHHDRLLYVEDPGMSRLHATVRFGGADVTLRDEGSHNGCFVNGDLVAGQLPLAPGDVLRCGRTLLSLVPDVKAFEGWRSWASTGPLVGGPAIRAVRRELRAYAPSDLELIVTGESGTGKELAAEMIHQHSGRAGPLVPVNCAELPEALFEAELFGARRGAFTGAVAERAGLFRAAHRGTLFLDEVGELPLGMQAKLLRVVERKEVRPLGGDRPEPADARLVAATNRDLSAQVERGQFRADLLHRLAGAVVRMPALREHPEDIPLMARWFIAEHGGAAAPTPTAAWVERLLMYRWPGNVRELQRVVRQALAQAAAGGQRALDPEHLRSELLQPGSQPVDLFSRVRDALSRQHGNVTRAAEELGVSRAQVYKLLEQRGLRAEDFR